MYSVSLVNSPKGVEICLAAKDKGQIQILLTHTSPAERFSSEWLWGLLAECIENPEEKASVITTLSQEKVYLKQWKFPKVRFYHVKKLIQNQIEAFIPSFEEKMMTHFATARRQKEVHVIAETARKSSMRAHMSGWKKAGFVPQEVYSEALALFRFMEEKRGTISDYLILFRSQNKLLAVGVVSGCPLFAFTQFVQDDSSVEEKWMKIVDYLKSKELSHILKSVFVVGKIPPLARMQVIERVDEPYVIATGLVINTLKNDPLTMSFLEPFLADAGGPAGRLKMFKKGIALSFALSAMVFYLQTGIFHQKYRLLSEKYDGFLAKTGSKEKSDVKRMSPDDLERTLPSKMLEGTKKLAAEEKIFHSLHLKPILASLFSLQAKYGVTLKKLDYLADGTDRIELEIENTDDASACDFLNELEKVWKTQKWNQRDKRNREEDTITISFTPAE